MFWQCFINEGRVIGLAPMDGPSISQGDFNHNSDENCVKWLKVWEWALSGTYLPEYVDILG